jgi:16S rRNA (guanine527-N7)-methyltransferase
MSKDSISPDWALLLQPGLDALGVVYDGAALERLSRYARRLLLTNQHMNLTAITEPAAVAQLHFWDSAALLPYCACQNAKLLDVGTGAGFPGLVLKILEPSLELHLLDSQQKRLRFLGELCGELELENVRFHHGRAEDFGHHPDLRDQFDLVTARALAPMPRLAEYCLPFVKPGGRFWAMKSQTSQEELREAARAIALLGGGEAWVTDYMLPPEHRVARRLIRVEKRTLTPFAYPRNASKIAKTPL